MFKQIAGRIATFQVDHEEPTADGKLILHINLADLGNAVVPLRKVGTEWKLDGSLVTEKETQTGDIPQ